MNSFDCFNYAILMNFIKVSFLHPIMKQRTNLGENLDINISELNDDMKHNNGKGNCFKICKFQFANSVDDK